MINSITSLVSTTSKHILDTCCLFVHALQNRQYMSPGSANKIKCGRWFHLEVSSEGGTCQILSVKQMLVSRMFPVSWSHPCYHAGWVLIHLNSKKVLVIFNIYTWVGWCGGWINHQLPQLVMEGIGGINPDGLGLVLHPPLCHWLQAVHFQPDHRAGLPYQLVKSVGLASLDAITPSTPWQRRMYCLLQTVGGLQESVAHTERSESPEERGRTVCSVFKVTGECRVNLYRLSSVNPVFISKLVLLSLSFLLTYRCSHLEFL